MLNIYGDKLNVEAIAEKLTVKPYKIFKKGDPVFKELPKSAKTRKTGLSFLVSNADFNQLNKQIKDAIKFLSNNKSEIKKITTNKNFEHARLDFGIEIRIGKNVIFQFDSFPYELLSLLGELKIDLETSLYPS